MGRFAKGRAEPGRSRDHGFLPNEAGWFSGIDGYGSCGLCGGTDNVAVYRRPGGSPELWPRLRGLSCTAQWHGRERQRQDCRLEWYPFDAVGQGCFKSVWQNHHNRRREICRGAADEHVGRNAGCGGYADLPELPRRELCGESHDEEQALRNAAVDLRYEQLDPDADGRERSERWKLSGRAPHGTQCQDRLWRGNKLGLHREQWRDQHERREFEQVCLKLRIFCEAGELWEQGGGGLHDVPRPARHERGDHNKWLDVRFADGNLRDDVLFARSL